MHDASCIALDDGSDQIMVFAEPAAGSVLILGRQLSKSLGVNVVGCERLGVLLQPEFLQLGFDVHPNLLVRATHQGYIVARRGYRIPVPMNVRVGSNPDSNSCTLLRPLLEEERKSICGVEASGQSG